MEWLFQGLQLLNNTDILITFNGISTSLVSL